MVKDKSMNDEEWNAWTEDVRTWLEEVDSHSIKSIEKGIEEDVVEDCIEDIVKMLARGDKRDSRREINKQNIQNAGRELYAWPKSKGMASTMPQFAQDTQATVLAGYDLANAAFYNTLEELGLEHYEMRRASKANGGTDGTPFGNVETFVKARHASKKQGLTRDFNDELWLATNISDAILRPFSSNDETTEEESA